MEIAEIIHTLKTVQQELADIVPGVDISLTSLAHAESKITETITILERD